MFAVINSGKFFQCIQDQGRGCAKQVGSLSCDNASVIEFHGGSRSTGFFLTL